MSGNDILKGSKHVKLKFDENLGSYAAQFKIQINELSSRYSGINLILQPQESDLIDRVGLSIKPLVIKDVVIKSKEKICKKLRGNL